ncbi:MAG: hypothetical protein F4X92_04055, partial [Gammaproteobacteria bacterium]|nr:hypothetical protein [Gammaproteobacteria bacterium]
MLLKERNLTQQLPDPPPLNLRHSDFSATGAVRTQGMAIGIGPAFQPERPAPDQLDTKTSRNGVAVSSGHWHDVQGRDGSATASEVIAFLQAFQRQTYRERGLSADLIIGDYNLPRTLRIGSNVDQSD